MKKKKKKITVVLINFEKLFSYCKSKHFCLTQEKHKAKQRKAKQ